MALVAGFMASFQVFCDQVERESIVFWPVREDFLSRLDLRVRFSWHFQNDW